MSPGPTTQVSQGELRFSASIAQHLWYCSAANETEPSGGVAARWKGVGMAFNAAHRSAQSAWASLMSPPGAGGPAEPPGDVHFERHRRRRIGRGSAALYLARYRSIVSVTRTGSRETTPRPSSVIQSPPSANESRTMSPRAALWTFTVFAGATMRAALSPRSQVKATGTACRDPSAQVETKVAR